MVLEPLSVCVASHCRRANAEQARCLFEIQFRIKHSAYKFVPRFLKARRVVLLSDIVIVQTRQKRQVFRSALNQVSNIFRQRRADRFLFLRSSWPRRFHAGFFQLVRRFNRISHLFDGSLLDWGVFQRAVARGDPRFPCSSRGRRNCRRGRR